MIPSFYEKRATLKRQFEVPNWLADSGISPEMLQEKIDEWEQTLSSKALIKAKTFSLIAEQAKIGIDPCDLFQDKLKQMSMQSLRLMYSP